MKDVIKFPSKSSYYVGKTVKVVRHGESLWLEVKSARPDGKLVAVLANSPLFWPESLGDAVEISPDEILREYDEGKAEREYQENAKRNTT
ncbi:MAG TPA: hypothetical protein ENH62_03250 [Marinobacter sp.]|uniref:Uncharacterized protein n=1 Tax=marine sediment metagenome TaxID=412755 RepID=A0A0F9TH89_9ZZZZ|nr:hypothetical protein [Marinobacter sp.]